MKKNIAIVVLSITTVLGFSYGYTQQKIATRNELEATKQRVIAEEQRVIAMANADSARVAMQRAAHEAELARVVRAAAEKALENCQ